ncbi:MAG: OmpH family outer membrane protein [Nitrospirae bacterium]|jgi:outer membrane protein|nr:OmpH family outer membrane protein [Nitrospirota bacterium]
MIFERKCEKTLVLAVIVSLGILFSGVINAAQAADVVGVVDVLKAFRQTDLGKSIQSHLKEFQKKKAEGIQSERQELQAEQKRIEQQVGVISKDALKAKELSFQQKVQDYRKKLQKIQTEVASENAVEIRKFLDALSHATVSVGKKYGFQVVLAQHPIRIPMGPQPPAFSSSRILYMNPKADLTESVIQYINKNNPVGNGQ